MTTEHDHNISKLTTDEVLDTLTMDQMRFIIHTSVVANHLQRYWLDQAVILSRSVKQ